MTGRLHHVGPVIIDVVMTVDTLPEQGGGTFASTARTLPGGGFNVIAAAARAGLEVVYGGAHGTGPHGDLVRSALRAEGVGIAHPPRPEDTGFCVALVDASAERTFVTRLGAETDLPLADLRTLRPFDETAVLQSVRKTNRCVVVEEGWPFCGIGAQVVDVVQRDAFDHLDAPVLRVSQADVPMPYNKQLERAAKPSAEKVVAAARRVLYLD